MQIVDISPKGKPIFPQWPGFQLARPEDTFFCGYPSKHLEPTCPCQKLKELERKLQQAKWEIARLKVIKDAASTVCHLGVLENLPKLARVVWAYEGAN